MNYFNENNYNKNMENKKADANSKYRLLENDKVLFLYNSEFNPDEKEKIKFAKKVGAKLIFSIDEFNTLHLIRKHNGTWKIEDDLSLFVFILCKLRIIKNKVNSIALLFDELKNKKEVEINDQIIFNAEFYEENFDKIIKIIMSLTFIEDYQEFLKSNGHFKCQKRIFHIKSDELLKKFEENISNKTYIKGVDNLGIINSEGDSLLFKTKMGAISFTHDDNKKEAVIIHYSHNFDIVDLHYYNNGIINNIINNVNNVELQPRKLKKSEIVTSIIGLLFFFLLTILTFTLIFTPDNVETSFLIIFSKGTLLRP